MSSSSEGTKLPGNLYSLFPTEHGVGVWLLNGGKAMNTKTLAAMIVALAMIAAPTMIIVADESDATEGVTGTYSVYAYNGEAWSSDVVNAYDAAQAVKGSSMWNTTTDSMVEKYLPGTWVTYNWDTYGNINTFMGQSNGENDWNVFVKIDGEWVAAASCLGSYKCFSDYDAGHRTANIMLYYGAGVTASSASSEMNGKNLVAESSITQVSSTEAYKVDFYLTVGYESVTPVVNGTVFDSDGIEVTPDDLKTFVIIITGFGSDAYLALLDAIGATNISAETTVPGVGYNAYGWMESMFGLGTVQTAGADTPTDWMDDKYAYWSIYDEHTCMNDTNDHLGDFVLGAYSPLVGAGSPFCVDSLALIYDEVAM